MYNTIFVAVYGLLTYGQLLTYNNIYDYYQRHPDQKKLHPFWNEDIPDPKKEPLKHYGNMVKESIFLCQRIVPWMVLFTFSMIYPTSYLFTDFESIFFNEGEMVKKPKTFMGMMRDIWRMFSFKQKKSKKKKKLKQEKIVFSTKSNQIKLDLLVDYDKTQILSDEIILNVFEYAYGERQTAKEVISSILYEYATNMDAGKKEIWNGMWKDLLELIKDMSQGTVGEWNEEEKSKFERKAKKQLYQAYIEWYSKEATDRWLRLLSVLIYNCMFMVRHLSQ